MEALPDVRPPATAIVPTHHRMIWNIHDLEVLGQEQHQTFQLSECYVEQLTHQKANEQVPLRHWWTASAFDPLVERERIRELADALHRQMQVLDQPFRVDRPRGRA